MLQSTVNARVSQRYKSTMLACVFSFTAGTVCSGLASALLCAARPQLSHQFQSGMYVADYWMFLASFLGILIVGGGAYFPAKISFSTYSTCTVVGQLSASMLFDRCRAGTAVLWWRLGQRALPAALMTRVGCVHVIAGW